MSSNVRHMWNCGMPQAGVRGAGFPVLESAEHTLIFAPEREDGAYNHHGQLTVRDDGFHAIWSNHTYGEDGPGQRVLHNRSQDGKKWTAPAVLFPSPQKMTPSEETGVVLTAFQWIHVDERLFAVAGCHENIGFCDFDRTDFTPKRDKDHPARARKGYSHLAREVRKDGTSGPAFAVWDDLHEAIEFDVLPCHAPEIAAFADVLRVALCSPLGMPAWDFRGNLDFPKAEDGHRLCEPTVHTAADGRYVMLLRDSHYSHRMYVSVSEDGEEWTPGVPTDIPDSPSLSDSLNLEDGTVLLVGNQMAPKFDNPAEVGHYNRDPLMVAVSRDGYTFDRAFALRCGGHEYRVPQSLMHGRGGGPQYPSAIVQEGRLYVLYSLGKEDIAISSAALEEVLAH